jgi:hypothetical protein
MVLNFNNTNDVNDLRESFDHLVKKNHEVQDDVKMAVRSEDYLKAVSAIDKFVKLIDEFMKKAHNMENNYKNMANYENASICYIAEEMAEQIKIAHLKVEGNILEKYKKKNNE